MTPEEKARARAAKGQARAEKKAERAAKKAERAAARAAKNAAIEARKEAARQKRIAADRAKAEKRHGRYLFRGRWLTRAQIIAHIADEWQKSALRETIRFEPTRSSRGLEMVSMRLGTTRAEFFVDSSMAVDALDLIDQVMALRSGAMAKKLGAKAKRKKAAERERQALAIGPPDTANVTGPVSTQASCFG